MTKQFEKKMMCKNCNQVEIGKSVEDGKWYEVQNETQLHFYKCPNAPHNDNKPKTWTKKEFKPIENDLRIDAINSEIKEMKKDILKLFDIVKAHGLQLDFTTGDKA